MQWWIPLAAERGARRRTPLAAGVTAYRSAALTGGAVAREDALLTLKRAVVDAIEGWRDVGLSAAWGGVTAIENAIAICRRAHRSSSSSR